jgi:hypothetical protein
MGVPVYDRTHSRQSARLPDAGRSCNFSMMRCARLALSSSSVPSLVVLATVPVGERPDGATVKVTVSPSARLPDVPGLAARTIIGAARNASVVTDVSITSKSTPDDAATCVPDGIGYVVVAAAPVTSMTSCDAAPVRRGTL